MHHDSNPGIALAVEGMTRREFIHGSAAIAAALGVPLTASAEAQERRAAAGRDARPVNCAFIGDRKSVV